MRLLLETTALNDPLRRAGSCRDRRMVCAERADRGGGSWRSRHDHL